MAFGFEGTRGARLLFATWLVLLAATAVTFSIGERQAAQGTTSAGLVIGLAALKAHLVVGVFMELRSAPRIWAMAMSGFLLAQTALLLAFFA